MATIAHYQEKITYQWKKSKAKLCEVDAVDTFKDLLSPDFEADGTFMYVIDEKQLYKAKHTTTHEFIGFKEE